MVVVVLDFASIPSSRLEEASRDALPVGAPPRRGKSEERMRAYHAGRAAVSVALSRAGLKARVRPNGSYGYLEVVDDAGRKIPDAFANLSHTGSFALAAVGPRSLGVDIESATRDATRVLARVATADERSRLGRLRGIPALDGIAPEIALWSSKEAFSKALGLGMKFGFQRLTVPFDDVLPFRVTTSLEGPLSLSEPAIHLERHGDHVIALCSELSLLSRGVPCVAISL